MSLFPEDIAVAAKALLGAARAKSLKIVTAESCTAGLVAVALTEIPGSSDVFERGFITYSNLAKAEVLGVDRQVLMANGAVSEAVAEAMVEGALTRSRANIALGITGIAGPNGGTPAKPIGLVYLGVGRRGQAPTVFEYRFGDVGRTEVRLASVREALKLLKTIVDA